MFILWSFCIIAHSFAESTGENSNADIDTTNSGQLSLQVDHSLDDGYTFSTRGNLLIHSLRSGSASMDSSVADGDESFVTEEQKDDLRKLCDKDGLYLLRLIGQDGSIHRTATHACNLVNSGMLLMWQMLPDAYNTPPPLYSSYEQIFVIYSSPRFVGGVHSSS